MDPNNSVIKRLWCIHYNKLGEAILMGTHNRYFKGGIKKIYISGYRSYLNAKISSKQKRYLMA